MANSLTLGATVMIGGAVLASFTKSVGNSSTAIKRISAETNQLKDRKKELNQVIAEQQRLGASANAVLIANATRERDAIDRRLKGLQQESDALHRLKKQYEENRKEIDSQSASLKKTIGVTAALFALPVAQAVSFETQMMRVGAVSRASDEELRQLGETAKQVTVGTQYSAVQAAKALELYGKDGQAVGATMKALPDVLNLASAGMMEVEAAAKLATDMFSGFGLTAADTARVGDVLTQTARTSSNTITDLGAALLEVAPAAKNAGVSFEETSAMLGQLSNLGLGSSKAAAALNTVIAKLATPTRKSADMLNQLGISMKDSAGNFRSMPTVLAELDKKLAGFGDAEKSQVLARIFGDSNVAAVRALMEQAGRGELQKYAQSIQKTGAASAEAQRQNAAAGAQFARFKTSMLNFANVIGTVVLPPVIALVDTGTALLSAATKLGQEYPRLTKVVVFATAGLLGLKAAFHLVRIAQLGVVNFCLQTTLGMSRLGSVLLATRALMVGSFFPAIAQAFKALGTAAVFSVGKIGGALIATKALLVGRIFPALIAGIRMVGVAFLTNPIGLAITAISVAGVLLWKNWKPVKEFFLNLWDGIKAKWNAAIEWITAKFEWVMNLWKKVKEFFGIGNDAPQIGAAYQASFAAAGAHGGTYDVAALPMPTMRAGGSKTYHNNTENNIVINAQPGQDSQAIARDVAREIERQQQIYQRSGLYDRMGSD